MLEVVMVSGSSPARACGVEDYTSALVEALRQRGLRVHHAHVTTLGELAPLALRCGPEAIVHVQYPVLSWRTSVVPLVLSSAVRSGSQARLLLTLHEFSRAHPLRRGLATFLGRLAHGWIGTTEAEARAARPWLGSSRFCGVVRIASNIGVHAPLLASADRQGLAYFGLLAPGKGLELYLHAAERAVRGGHPAVVVGTPVRGHEAWLDTLLRTHHPHVQFRLNVEAEGVSRILAGSQLAYLPFPDGVSERRATAMAALAHGAQVVTTRGADTTPELARLVHIAQTQDEAQRIIVGLLSGKLPARPQAELLAYAAQRSWPSIAEAHESLYRGLTAANQSSGRAR